MPDLFKITFERYSISGVTDQSRDTFLSFIQDHVPQNGGKAHYVAIANKLIECFGAQCTGEILACACVEYKKQLEKQGHTVEGSSEWATNYFAQFIKVLNGVNKHGSKESRGSNAATVYYTTVNRQSCDGHDSFPIPSAS